MKKNNSILKLHEVAEKLFHDIEFNAVPKEDMGLFTGSTGIIIFCKHYEKNFPNIRNNCILKNYVNLLFEQLMSGMVQLPFCSGLTGVLSGLRYMNEEELLSIDYSDIEENYKKYLQRFSLENIRNNNYDFFHGGLGIVKYFAESSTFVNQAINALDEVAIKDCNIYKWLSHLGIENRYGYNISLCHGIASIVSVLSSLSHPDIDYEKRDRIITGACNYLLTQEIERDKYGCQFPSISAENQSDAIPLPSRLAWCYGDLGIAVALWQAGKVLHNNFWTNKAIEIFSFSANRKNLDDCKIVDAGLCHGTSSIYMMYKYMFTQTNKQIFEETLDYWLEKTLEMGESPNGLSGYMSWKGYKRSWELDYGLLDGLSGIGLVLLTDLGYIDNKWMDFFLLN